eukprot:TRINITY_DN7205_c0_g1_i1.p1 TRINITY_DN7205_c0_g1~~TRINITY_DN7205_c0_g1_i1.p1  ORF type:complete len:130 (-),score=12.81 TRINITY_DN7205_c0_g1_i1:48-437(-)
MSSKAVLLTFADFIQKFCAALPKDPKPKHRRILSYTTEMIPKRSSNKKARQTRDGKRNASVNKNVVKTDNSFGSTGRGGSKTKDSSTTIPRSQSSRYQYMRKPQRNDLKEFLHVMQDEMTRTTVDANND